MTKSQKEELDNILSGLLRLNGLAQQVEEQHIKLLTQEISNLINKVSFIINLELGKFQDD